MTSSKDMAVAISTVTERRPFALKLAALLIFFLYSRHNSELAA